MIYRRMQAADVPEVTALLRTSFSSRLWPYMTYAQHGIGTFLAARLAHPCSFPQQFFGVAMDEQGRVNGYADFRLTSPSECFLSYVCVSKDARRLGVATGLIEYFCASQVALEWIGLDVFLGNDSALRLYETLGFALTGQRSTWLWREMPACSTELRVSDLTTSRAAHTVYGFCEFSVEWQGREIRLGRIGTDVLRCFDLDTFGDEELLAGVRATFSDVTRALAIVASDDLDADSGKTHVLVESVRMKGSVRTVMGRALGDA